MRKTRTGILLVMPATLSLIFLFLYPFIYNIWVSFYEYNPLVSPNMTFVGLSNYVNQFGNYVFQVSIANTLIFTGASVTLELLLGFFLALALANIGKGRNFFAVLLLIPMLMPDVVATLGWRFILSPNFGIMNYILGTFVPWLSNPSFALFSIIIVDVWKTTPFILIILLAGILSIPTELTESMKTDGAGAWEEFRYLSLPHLIPFILVAVTIRTIDAFTKVFTVVYLLTGGGPGVATEVLPISIFRYSLVTWDWGIATSLSTIALIISLIFLYVFLKIIRRK